MQRGLRIFTYITIFILGLTWIYISRPNGTETGIPRLMGPHIGFQAPEISLNTFEGDEISLSDFKGYPVIVNFWASWCPPCRTEMPALQRAYDNYAEKGVVFLAVNELNQDSRSAVLDFVEENALTFPILADELGIASKVYQVSSLPTTFFIDANGVIKDIVIGGPMVDALLRTRIDNLLSEQQ